MAQINKYENKAAYTADKKRSLLKSALSFLTDQEEIISDGVNVIVDKPAAGVGDLVVYDKIEKRFRFVKAGTVRGSAIKANGNLHAAGVVYAVKGDKVKIVSLDQGSARWAHPFEAMLTGINAGTAGSLSVTVASASGSNAETISVNWTSGSSLSAIAEKIASAFGALSHDPNKKWSAAASTDGSGIIISHNWYSSSKVTAVTGCTLAAQDDKDYQIEYAYLSGTEYVRRRNDSTSYYAAAHLKKFYEYYSTNGTTPSEPVALGSTTVVTEAAFNDSEHCTALREKYATYKDYLSGEHFAEYPSRYGALGRDGRENTAFLSAQKGTIVRGALEPRYPAAADAASYGITIDGVDAHELAPGAWWLPSAEEMVELVKDRRLNSGDRDADPVNDTLAEMGGSSIYGSGWYPWTSCEYNSRNAYFFDGHIGLLGNYYKYYSYSVRRVSAL